MYIEKLAANQSPVVSILYYVLCKIRYAVAQPLYCKVSSEMAEH